MLIQGIKLVRKLQGKFQALVAPMNPMKHFIEETVTGLCEFSQKTKQTGTTTDSRKEAGIAEAHIGQRRYEI